MKWVYTISNSVLFVTLPLIIVKKKKNVSGNINQIKWLK